MRAAPHRGHERRLKSGAWEVQVSLAGQRRTVRGDTLTEARARLAELVADHQRGLTGRDARRERTPLAQWLRAWLEGRRGTVVPSTWAMHRVCVERRLVPLLGRVPLRDLEAADVRRAYARLQRPPYSHAPGTVRRTHATLSLALQQAVSDGVLARNVARGIALPRRPRSEARALTPDEVRRLLRAAPAERRPLWAVAVYTGLRTGELLGLSEFGGEPMPVLNLARLVNAPPGANPSYPVTIVVWVGPAGLAMVSVGAALLRWSQGAFVRQDLAAAVMPVALLAA